MNPLDVINSEYSRLSLEAGYSLREFARYLDIDPSSLSKILSGKRGIPKSSASRIADKLFGTVTERDEFIKAVLAYNLKSPVVKKKAEVKLDQNTSSDMFFIISQWEYFAILNVLGVKTFDHSVNFLAKSLNISSKRVKQCLDVLQRNEFISMENGKIIRKIKKLNTTNDILSRALKLAHMEELDLAKNKIDVDVEKKYYRSNTFTIAMKDIKKIKKVIDKMNHDINMTADKSSPEEVYILSCQLFPLTNCEMLSKTSREDQYVH